MERIFPEKKPISGRWVAIFDRIRNDRNLIVNDFQSRCIPQGEVHEFLVCNTGFENRQSVINHVGYLGFGEILNSSVIAVGDEFWIGRDLIGTILGFDDTHMPNHQNIVIFSKEIRSGFQLELQPDQPFYIKNAK